MPHPRRPICRPRHLFSARPHKPVEDVIPAFILVVFTAGKTFTRQTSSAQTRLQKEAPAQSRGLAAGRREKNCFPFFSPLPALFKTRPCSLIQSFSAEHLIRLQTVTQTFMATHAIAAHHNAFFYYVLLQNGPQVHEWNSHCSLNTTQELREENSDGKLVGLHEISTLGGWKASQKDESDYH